MLKYELFFLLFICVLRKINDHSNILIGYNYFIILKLIKIFDIILQMFNLSQTIKCII